MATAGVLSGIFIGGSFGLLFESPSIKHWTQYNSIFIFMFLLLGVSSILLFDPVTTVAALMAQNERPDELINKAMPMTLVFTIAFSIIISLLYGRRLLHYGVILITCTILMIILGLNVSILGFVEISTNSIYLILELFGLIIIIFVVFAGVFIPLERKHLLFITGDLN